MESGKRPLRYRHCRPRRRAAIRGRQAHAAIDGARRRRGAAGGRGTVGIQDGPMKVWRDFAGEMVLFASQKPALLIWRPPFAIHSPPTVSSGEFDATAPASAW